MSKQHLGNITKSASTGKQPSSIALRFALQSAARELIPQERIKACFRYHLPNEDKVRVHRHKNAKKAYFSGLMVCGSVWHCPVCAQRVSEERRKELHYAMMNWTGGLAMVTYTMSHHEGTSAAVLVDAVTDGLRRFKSGREFNGWKSQYGWMGSVKALEITHGENGWHPHVHEIVFFSNTHTEAEFDKLHLAMRIRWRDILGARGYLASTERGLVLQTADSELAEYVAKWGHEPSVDNPNFKGKWSMESELTKAAIKKGKRKGRTPTQLLMDYVAGDDEAGDLWREYALTMKGKRQLVWSSGMRDMLRMGIERQDEEISAEVPKETVLYASFNIDQWRKILRHELRGEILNRAGYMEQDDFSQWLAQLMKEWE